MGDHRPTITCHFEMHGHKADFDFGWCNWSDNGDGIDQRIVDWFREQSQIAMTLYQNAIYEFEWGAREKQQREDELATLARLKAKYEGS